jgi:hypothetical protein
MTQNELIEQLADKEHASWARWMQYLFSICENHNDGSVTVPTDLVLRWSRQAQMPYADLSEREKQSDRDEVAHILPIIDKHVNDKLTNVVVKTISHGGIMNPLRKPLQGN